MKTESNLNYPSLLDGIVDPVQETAVTANLAMQMLKDSGKLGELAEKIRQKKSIEGKFTND